VQLIGNLGNDPEVRILQNGGRIVTLSIATSESWKDRSCGERKQRTEWHRVVIFSEGLGEIVGAVARGRRALPHRSLDGQAVLLRDCGGGVLGGDPDP